MNLDLKKLNDDSVNFLIEIQILQFYKLRQNIIECNFILLQITERYFLFRVMFNGNYTGFPLIFISKNTHNYLNFEYYLFQNSHN